MSKIHIFVDPGSERLFAVDARGVEHCRDASAKKEIVPFDFAVFPGCAITAEILRLAERVRELEGLAIEALSVLGVSQPPAADAVRVLGARAEELHDQTIRPGAWREARIAALEAHLDGIRKTLRIECADLGDNDWSDDLHLGDVVEKHLGRPAQSRIAALEAENRDLREHVERLQAMDRLMAEADLPAVIRGLQEDRASARRELLVEITKAGAIFAQEVFPAEAVAYLERALERILPEAHPIAPASPREDGESQL
jgi:hypothetical protein